MARFGHKIEWRFRPTPRYTMEDVQFLEQKQRLQKEELEALEAKMRFMEAGHVERHREKTKKMKKGKEGLLKVYQDQQKQSANKSEEIIKELETKLSILEAKIAMAKSSAENKAKYFLDMIEGLFEDVTDDEDASTPVFPASYYTMRSKRDELRGSIKSSVVIIEALKKSLNESAERASLTLGSRGPVNSIVAPEVKARHEKIEAFSKMERQWNRGEAPIPGPEDDVWAWANLHYWEPGEIKAFQNHGCKTGRDWIIHLKHLRDTMED
jgi:hypothetical protein